ncbi:MAG: hypothetical protein J6B43_06495, partial [Lachnospiraceae bacterium]|nr:hypothetical protein [Lachnospiraceae bacterium]
MNQLEIKRKQMVCYTYILGLIGLMSMGKLLGDNGLCYLALALESVSLFTLLLTAGSAEVIAHLQKNRRTKGQYKGVARMRGQLLLLQGVTGLLLTVIFLLLADPLAEKRFLVPDSAAALKMLAPVIVIQALDAVLLGYFQGNGSQMPTLISAVLRQGFFLVFGSLFGRILAGYGDKVSGLLKNDNYSGMYGAMGVALGILLTELLVLLFLFIIYMGSDRKADAQRSQEGLRRTESMGDTVRLYYGTGWQSILISLLALLPVPLGAALYLRAMIPLGQAVSATDPESGDALGTLMVTDAVADYGSLFGKCLLLCGVFILLLTARCFSVYGRLHAAVRREDARHGRDLASAGLHFVWTAGLFLTVTMAVTAPQMAAGFFPGRDEGAAQLLRAGSIMILLAGLVILFSMILLSYGEQYLLMGALGIWLILDVILQNLLVKASGYQVIGILYSLLTATGILTVGLAAYMVWRRRFSREYIRILGIPLIGAGIAGLVMMLVIRLLSAHVGNLVCLLVAA